MYSPFESAVTLRVKTGAFVDDGDFGVAHDGAGRVGHGPEDGAADRLRERGGRTAMLAMASLRRRGPRTRDGE